MVLQNHEPAFVTGQLHLLHKTLEQSLLRSKDHKSYCVFHGSVHNTTDYKNKYFLCIS